MNEFEVLANKTDIVDKKIIIITFGQILQLCIGT